MRKMLFWLGILSIIGCQPEIERGIVVGKTYTPAQTVLMPMRVGSITVLQPYILPENYTITIEDKGRKVNYSVMPKEYMSVSIGDSLSIAKSKKEEEK